MKSNGLNKKTCKDCREVFPKNEDYFPYRTYETGYRYPMARCIACHRAYNAEMKRRQRERDKK